MLTTTRIGLVFALAMWTLAQWRSVWIDIDTSGRHTPWIRAFVTKEGFTLQGTRSVRRSPELSPADRTATIGWVNCSCSLFPPLSGLLQPITDGNLPEGSGPFSLFAPSTRWFPYFGDRPITWFRDPRIDDRAARKGYEPTLSSVVCSQSFISVRHWLVTVIFAVSYGLVMWSFREKPRAVEREPGVVRLWFLSRWRSIRHGRSNLRERAGAQCDVLSSNR